GDDHVQGGAGNDELHGRDGNDRIEGGSGNDILNGGAGDDVLAGGSGTDVILGGAGQDVLNGGSGRDVFIFKAGFGRDVIEDFAASGPDADILSVSSALFADAAALLGAAEQVGGDVVITIDDETALTLRNVQLSALGAEDFRFI
ncbi:MAG: endonuclease/exonuclease/phosphatase, partial [Hyphomicrobiales bacterium]|nr:endonuclease/exonuclease/phosphatase [Hyphomicrobiales bacterium]